MHRPKRKAPGTGLYRTGKACKSVMLCYTEIGRMALGAAMRRKAAERRENDASARCFLDHDPAQCTVLADDWGIFAVAFRHHADPAHPERACPPGGAGGPQYPHADRFFRLQVLPFT